MFVTANQFYVFAACFCFGGAAGIILSFVQIAKRVIKIKPICCLADIFTFVLIAISYVVYSYRMCFPSLRFYMIFGVFLGIAVCVKSFGIILAKFGKKLYNKLINQRGKKRDGRKV